jgi:hypothetical protein
MYWYDQKSTTLAKKTSGCPDKPLGHHGLGYLTVPCLKMVSISQRHLTTLPHYSHLLPRMCWKSQQEMRTRQFEKFSHVFYFPMYASIDVLVFWRLKWTTITSGKEWSDLGRSLFPCISWAKWFRFPWLNNIARE